MKTISLPLEGLTVERLLQETADDGVVFLTQNGQVKLAVLPADEGDQEVLAIRSNKELMDYLMESVQRGRTGPRKTIEQIREQFGCPPGSSGLGQGNGEDEPVV